MKWLLLFCLLSGAMGAAPDSPAFDPTEFLLRVRKKVVASVDRLPNYVCRETVDRSRSLPTIGKNDLPRFDSDNRPPSSCDVLAQLRQNPGWRKKKIQFDRLAFDVAVSKDGEMYSLVGENRFSASNPAELPGMRVNLPGGFSNTRVIPMGAAILIRKISSTGGVVATGSFGIFLKDIFVSDAATFTYKGETNFGGRTLAEFGYSVPLEKGGYAIQATVRDQKTGQHRTYSAVVPYDGTFLVDPQSFDLVRLVVHADKLPQNLQMCETAVTLDYANTRLNNSEFLLPTNTRLDVVNSDGTELEDDTGFSGCSEFRSESTVRFDAPPQDRSATAIKTAPDQPRLPAAQQEQLAAIRNNVLASLHALPKYLCTETIDRSTFLPEGRVPNLSCNDLANRRKDRSWRVHESQSDRLRLDVAVSPDQGEMYSWVGENRFHDRSLADLVGNGVTSTGAFSALLTTIFDANAATFSYNGEKNVDGHKLVEFGFRVPFDKSAFNVGNRKYNSIVPYAGVFLADPTTSRLARLIVDVDQLPEPLHTCQETTVLDYSNVRLNSIPFLLPSTSSLHVDYDNGAQSKTRTVFSAYHEFVGESTLSFDAPPTTRAAANRGLFHEPLALPDGLPFKLVLTRPIDTKTAAAGDTISAKLTTPIIHKNNRVLLPKGATVTGRILQSKRIYSSRTFFLTIRLETIDNNGVRDPFRARLAPVYKRLGYAIPSDKSVGQNLGSFDQMPELADSDTGILDFRGSKKDFVIRPGFKLEGTTMELEP